MVFAFWPKPLNEGEDEWLEEQRQQREAEEFFKDEDQDNVPDGMDSDVTPTNDNMSTWQDSDSGSSSWVDSNDASDWVETDDGNSIDFDDFSPE